MKSREYVDKTGQKRFQILFDNDQEANTFYVDSLHRILSDSRYYLDHLDECIEFQVPWVNYSGKKGCANRKRVYATSHPKKWLKTETFINKS